MGTKELLRQMNRFGSKHYPLSDVCIALGKGVYIRDTDGKTYIDAASGYGSVGLGHNHPEILALIQKLNTPDEDGWAPVNVVPNTHSTPALGTTLEFICAKLGYDRALATNGGAEANEAAIKLMRKWGYTKKGVAKGKAQIVVCAGNFAGRTTTIVGFSSEPTYKDNFGPYADDAFITIPFGDWAALKDVLDTDVASGAPRIVGIHVEPIQGEGGVVIPDWTFLSNVRALCSAYNVIFCADEIQTGLGRTGKWLACEHSMVKPDLLVLGKTLGAGKQAVAMVLGKEEFMVFTPGDHGSTYGGNFAAMAIAYGALSIIENEHLVENAAQMGAYLLSEIKKGLKKSGAMHVVKEVRGLGLMIGIEPKAKGASGKLIKYLLEEGVLTKDAHNVIRITPPLIINKAECALLASGIVRAFARYAKH